MIRSSWFLVVVVLAFLGCETSKQVPVAAPSSTIEQTDASTVAAAASPVEGDASQFPDGDAEGEVSSEPIRVPLPADAVVSPGMIDKPNWYMVVGTVSSRDDVSGLAAESANLLSKSGWTVTHAPQEFAPSSYIIEFTKDSRAGFVKYYTKQNHPGIQFQLEVKPGWE